MTEVGNKKRIMLIVPMLHQGGFERICVLTARLLSQIYKVHVVIFSSEDMFYDVSGLHVIDLKLGVVPGKLAKVLNIFKRVRRVRKLKKELGIQISYSFGTTANLVNVLSKGKDITWAGIRGYGALEERPEMDVICRLADRVVSCTKVMEEDIAKSYSVKSSATLYNPCNLEEIKRLSEESITPEFEEFLRKPGKTVVSMGREDDIKGFWHLIKSVYLVRKKVPDVKLMIIGDGVFTEYRELVGNLGMEDAVLFTGVQKNPFALLARADIYALTSDSEGFPNALIEAMALGLPCISVNCKTGPAEILQNNYTECEVNDRVYAADYGVLAPILTGKKDLTQDSFTSEEQIFADELARLLADEAVCASYREKAIQRAYAFGMEAYVQDIGRLIEESDK